MENVPLPLVRVAVTVTLEPVSVEKVNVLKPSCGRIPTPGVLPACRTRDVRSVFALTVADAGAVMAVMEGADDEPRFAWPELQPPWLGASREALRLGVPADPGCDTALGFDRAFDQARARARELGAELVTVDFAPLYEVAQLLYDGPWVAERHAVVQALLANQPDALDATVADVIRAAHGYNATAAFRARYRLEELRAALAPLWQRVDALMVPTAPTCPTRTAVALAPVDGVVAGEVMALGRSGCSSSTARAASAALVALRPVGRWPVSIRYSSTPRL